MPKRAAKKIRMSPDLTRPIAGSRRIGLKDVAARAGVSVAAVSMALADHPQLNVATKERIRKICREMGYRRRRKHAKPKLRNFKRFGFVLLGSLLKDDVHQGLLAALQASAAAVGLEMDVLALPDLSQPQRVMDEIWAFASRLDALILSGYVDAPLLAELDAAGCPHVLIGRAMVDLLEVSTGWCQVVTADDQAMGVLATRKLIAAGHEKIAFICERVPRGLWAQQWLRGYRQALLEEGFKLDPDLVQITGQAMSGAQPAVDQLIQKRVEPTAYIAPDIRVGASLVQALGKHGKRLEPPNMVVSGHERLLARYDMEAWPWIGFDLATMANVAVRQLRELHLQPLPCPTQVIIPYATRNL